MKTILLDCDGVLVDFVGATFRAFPELGFTKRDVQDWDYFDMFGDHKPRLFDLLKTDDFWLSLKPKPGAKEAIEFFREKGCRLVLVTSPWVSCRTWEYCRRTLVKRLFGDFDGMVFTSQKELVDGDILIDDNIDHIYEWTQTHNKSAVLFEANYNRDFLNTSKIRLANWDDLDMIWEMINEA